MKKVFTVLVLVLLGITGYYLFFLKDPEVFFLERETESKFLLLSNEEIIYSSNKLGRLSLFTYKNLQSTVVDSAYQDVTNPLLYDGRYIGLVDRDGDESFSTTNDTLNKKNISAGIKTIFSIDGGRILIYQLTEDNNVYLHNIQSNTSQILISKVEKLHDVAYSNENNLLVINYDSILASLHLNKSIGITVLDSSANGDKMNPFLYGNQVYYSNNLRTDFFQIYSIDLSDERREPKVIHTASHDLRLPKRVSAKLYFIEIINNEYLLKKKDLATQETTRITNKGVVYSYEIVGDNNLVLSYSDFDTPKCLFKYNSRNESLINLTGKRVNHELGLQFIERDAKRSPCYVVSPPKSQVKGVILFMHPGSDFSPRWDNILMSLCANGFRIYCPNYPGSSGYGKAYGATDYKKTRQDINNWKQFISETHPGLPLHYLSYSSGNTIMERTLQDDIAGVKSAVSLFGLPGVYQPDFKIPSLYILGKNDSRIIFKDRIIQLDTLEYKNLTVGLYDDEGHMFKKLNNLGGAIRRVIRFYNSEN